MIFHYTPGNKWDSIDWGVDWGEKPNDDEDGEEEEAEEEDNNTRYSFSSKACASYATVPSSLSVNASDSRTSFTSRSSSSGSTETSHHTGTKKTVSWLDEECLSSIDSHALFESLTSIDFGTVASDSPHPSILRTGRRRGNGPLRVGQKEEKKVESNLYARVHVNSLKLLSRMDERVKFIGHKSERSDELEVPFPSSPRRG